VEPTFWQLLFRDELLALLNHAVAALPWLLGLIGVAGLVGYSPLGKGLLGLRRARERSNELLEEVTEQLGALRRSVTDVSERLEATEFHMRSLTGGLSAGRLPRGGEPPRERITTPV
jgi:hypothetical protein